MVGDRIGEPVILTAVERGGEMVVLTSRGRVGERAVGEKLGDVVEFGEVERLNVDGSDEDARRGGGMVKGSTAS